MSHLLRVTMCEAAHRLWERGLVGASEGNLSVRIGPDRLLCTPSGVSKGHLEPEELVVIDLDGNAIGGGIPSSEIKLHTRIMAKRPDCQAMVHAHPPIATAFSIAGVEIPDNVIPESAAVLGSVVTVPFAMPGTDEVPDAIEPLLAGHKTFLLSHHGAVTLGKDLMDAYNRMETLERIAKMILIAHTLGGPKPMPDSAFERIQSLLNGNL